MKKISRLLLFLAAVGLVTGAVIKLQGFKNIGDAFLGVSTLIWFYIIGSFIYERAKKGKLKTN
ncbi:MULTISPECIES: hypothetical protein [unclassified Flavobacterium]|uniref:hypothetical protein n=1 Tax=unclassified Flavobacterium TaxID=196869 RepID=UPI000A3D6FA1|nr:MULTISPECIES: hypothetical protein [unclassified Flavobacterium]MEA9412946.1 hypothetical protein [Flavobacterium sp. PL02]OUL61832.1 hypothetical protein B8T70_13315 [Flavobacterium sp. AJR]